MSRLLRPGTDAVAGSVVGHDGVTVTGELRGSLTLPASELDRMVLRGVTYMAVSNDGVPVGDALVKFRIGNGVVNTGLNVALDRLFGLGGPPGALSHIAVSPDDQAVTAATTLLDPATGDTGFVAKAFSPAASRTLQTVTAGATFTQADVSFAMNKIGLLNTSTDAGTGLFDVIGGSGASPYNEPFTLDLTLVTTWSLTLQLLITLAAT